MAIYQSYEIRPCVEYDGSVVSFLGDPVHCPTRGADIYTPQNAGKAAQDVADEHGLEVFWTLYGWNGEGHDAIGDFKSFEAALGVLNAIIAPMREAADLSADFYPRKAADRLYDIINQSSTEERL